MMQSTARHLHVVDAETGERLDRCPQCAVLEDQLAGAERDINAWRLRYANLERDREREAREHKLWPVAVEIVGVWRKACNHPRSSFGAVEFELLRPFLQDGQYGEDVEARKLVCLRAVAGAAFDPFTTRRKNGSRRRHDSLDLIFRSRSKLEDFVNRAPADWRKLVGLEEASDA